LLTLMTKFVALANPHYKKIAVPVTASGEIDLLAEKMNLDLIKTRDSHLALMEAASDKDIRFVGGSKGGFIFNEFLFASDAMYSVAKLLECMALTKKRFGEIDSETVRLHGVRKHIVCPFHIKGAIMRRLMQDTESIPRDLVEGVRLFPKDSGTHTTVLLNPDRTRPLFHIFAESEDPSIAERFAEEYETKLTQWIKNE
jgi:mannose-1-phosphate guanylyltransferase/phosphomannomutase